MKTQLLEISETGRGADKEEVAMLEASAADRRRWAIELVVADRESGHRKSAAFLDGVRIKPTQEEIDAAMEPYRRIANGKPATDARKKIRKRGLKRLRSVRR